MEDRGRLESQSPRVMQNLIPAYYSLVHGHEALSIPTSLEKNSNVFTRFFVLLIASRRVGSAHPTNTERSGIFGNDKARGCWSMELSQESPT